MGLFPPLLASPRLRRAEPAEGVMGLFPPLLPTDLVFQPGDPQEFRRLVEEELGPVDGELEVVEQEAQQMINEFEVTVGELGLLDPDVAEVAVVREEIGLDPLPAEHDEVVAAVAAGQADLNQLLAIAGLLPDQQVPPAPPAPTPDGGGGPPPPPGGGGGDPSGVAPGGGNCFVVTTNPCDAFGCTTVSICLPTGPPGPLLG